ncbi:flagellin, partial [Escherichia coli O2:H6]
ATATATGAKAATIQTDKGTFTSDGTAFDGASMSIDANTFANAVKNDTYTATVGAKTYSVTTGSAAADTAYMSNGVLSDTPPTYYAQADGSITTTEDAAAGKLVYKGSDGKLTTDTTSKAESTSDPLAALDDAISQIDKFRSSLGAVQNRLDSAVTNLNNTTTNLSEAQSRIQDADYATEVSNMSKAQIIQQAGNSVLAKANQVPQQVLSLLQG